MNEPRRRGLRERALDAVESNEQEQLRKQAAQVQRDREQRNWRGRKLGQWIQGELGLVTPVELLFVAATGSGSVGEYWCALVDGVPLVGFTTPTGQMGLQLLLEHRANGVMRYSFNGVLGLGQLLANKDFRVVGGLRTSEDLVPKVLASI